jgi:Flp pilus assembly protein TadG
MNWGIKNSGLRSERGQSLVEMAFAVVLFFTLLFSIIEFGRALWTYNSIVQSTRAGARWAVVNVGSNADTTNIDRTKNIVVYASPDVSTGIPTVPGLDKSMVSVSVVTVDSDSNGIPINQKISVSVNGFQFQFIVPIVPNISIPAYETTLYTESMGVIPS